MSSKKAGLRKVRAAARRRDRIAMQRKQLTKRELQLKVKHAAAKAAFTEAMLEAILCGATQEEIAEESAMSQAAVAQRVRAAKERQAREESKRHD